MLNLDKSRVDFLVTSSMVQEVESFLANSSEKIKNVVDKLVDMKVRKIYFVGCGSSNAVGVSGKYIFDKYSNLSSDAYTGWEFIDNTPRTLGKDTAVILISQSGNTEEIGKALDKANAAGALTIGIVNEGKGNKLADDSKVVLDYNAHAMWECQLICVYQIAGGLIQRTEPNSEIEKILADIPKLPKILGHHIDTFEEKAKELAKGVAEWKGFYTITAGPLLSLAYKEGVITNMEFMWGHGSVIQSGEFRHGPLEITEKGVPFVFILGTDESRHTTERALNFVRKYEGEAIVLDYAELSMGLHSALAPMVMFVPLEWFSYYFAIVRDHNPDDRRYYNVVKY